MIWADTTPDHPSVPVTLGKKPTELDGVVARTAYTVSHKPTWGEMVSGTSSPRPLQEARC